MDGVTETASRLARVCAGTLATVFMCIPAVLELVLRELLQAPASTDCGTAEDGATEAVIVARYAGFFIRRMRRSVGMTFARGKARLLAEASPLFGGSVDFSW